VVVVAPKQTGETVATLCGVEDVHGDLLNFDPVFARDGQQLASLPRLDRDADHTTVCRAQEVTRQLLDLNRQILLQSVSSGL
jgi:hypothetical protein